MGGNKGLVPLEKDLARRLQEKVTSFNAKAGNIAIAVTAALTLLHAVRYTSFVDPTAYNAVLTAACLASYGLWSSSEKGKLGL